MISGYKSYLKLRVFLHVPSSPKKQKNQTIEFYWGLYCLVVLFHLLYVICASVPTEGIKPKLKYIPSSVSLLHVLDFPPVSAGHSSKWLKYLNEKKSKCKTKVYRLNVTFIKTYKIGKLSKQLSACT